MDIKVTFHPHILMQIRRYIREEMNECFMTLIGRIRGRSRAILFEVNDAFPFSSELDVPSEHFFLVQRNWVQNAIEYIKLKYSGAKSVRILGFLHSHARKGVTPSPSDLDFGSMVVAKEGNALMIIFDRRENAKCFLLEEEKTIQLPYKKVDELL